MNTQDKPTDAFPFPTADKHAKPEEVPVKPSIQQPTEDALDHGIEESFPASDPVSVSVTKTVPAADETTPDDEAAPRK